MLRKKAFFVVCVACLLVLISGVATAGGPIRTLSVSDVGIARTTLKFTVNVDRINCSNGANPWVGLSILHPPPNEQIEDLSGQAVTGQGEISWKWTPPRQKVEEFMFTIGYWCGTQEIDRYPKRGREDKLTADNVIKNGIPWRTIRKNMTEQNP